MIVLLLSPCPQRPWLPAILWSTWQLTILRFTCCQLNPDPLFAGPGAFSPSGWVEAFWSTLLPSTGNFILSWLGTGILPLGMREEKKKGGETGILFAL